MNFKKGLSTFLSCLVTLSAMGSVKAMDDNSFDEVSNSDESVDANTGRVLRIVLANIIGLSIGTYIVYELDKRQKEKELNELSPAAMRKSNLGTGAAQNLPN